MTDDRSQVGLTEDADEKLTILRTETPYFEEDADVYRFCVAIAIALRVEITPAMKKQTIKTKWRTVKDNEDEGRPLPRLDTPDRMLAGLISAHRPEWASEPYRYSQYLAVAGISYLHNALINEELTLHDTLKSLETRQAGE